MIVLSSFLVLELTTVRTYWRVLNRDEINARQGDDVRNVILSHMIFKDFQKRPARETSEVSAPNTRRRTDFEKQNQLVNLKKQMSENNVRRYGQLTDRDGYFTVCDFEQCIRINRPQARRYFVSCR